MKQTAIKCLLVVASISMMAVPGYAKRKKAPPDPRFASIGQIVVLPVVDARAGKKDKVSLESLRKAAINNLHHKNYDVVSSNDEGAVGDIADEDLNGARPGWVKKLGPSDARWVLVVGLDDAHSKITFGSTGNAEVEGFLFDKQQGTVVWKGTGVGQAGQGGLMGMAMKGMMRGAALDSAMFNLLSGIPKLPKKGK